ncbi:MAG: hypothetical protein ACREOP_01925 [Thermodesulfobacteriota bacterium]
MPRTVGVFRREVKNKILVELTKAIDEGNLPFIEAEQLIKVSRLIAETVARYVHENHYPMAPEVLEDSTKPPVDPGPNRIA